ncbi:hypothetical protein [Chromobacterium vaccinii]|uniref:hypothetical protein n=1 Tax=Chromobacterium vaccinii TaxID=1108595 RepID=UPI001184D66C|nr:hypothetical protein [Chromobacterium vaccinii]
MFGKINVVYDGEKYIGYEAEDMPLPALHVGLCQRLNQFVSERRQLAIREAFGWIDAYAAETAALAFVSSNYQSVPPILIQAWADEKGMSARSAADDIVGRANKVRLLLSELSEILKTGRAEIEESLNHSEALLALQTAFSKVTA